MFCAAGKGGPLENGLERHVVDKNGPPVYHIDGVTKR
jgi:hypothetical protein